VSPVATFIEPPGKIATGNLAGIGRRSNRGVVDQGQKQSMRTG
jgi:hypothetical protein